MFITLSLLTLGTEGIFSIMTTSDVNHLVNGTPEAMVTLMMVFIVCRIALSKHVSYLYHYYLIPRKIYSGLGVGEREKL